MAGLLLISVAALVVAEGSFRVLRHRNRTALQMGFIAWDLGGARRSTTVRQFDGTLCAPGDRVAGVVFRVETETILAKMEPAQAAAILRGGGVVAFPTETVYGLGANALDPSAVARVSEIKRRLRFDPLIIPVSSVAQGQQLVRDWRLDALGLERIVAVEVPDVGTGLAINDRLRRAGRPAPDQAAEVAT